MKDFNTALDLVLTFQPFITFSLAAIGLATVFLLIWQVLKPLVSYLATSRSHMLVFWCTLLIVGGFTLLGLGADANLGVYYGAGASASGTGLVVLGIYWLRKWVKWNYKEVEEYK